MYSYTHRVLIREDRHLLSLMNLKEYHDILYQRFEKGIVSPRDLRNESLKKAIEDEC